VPGLGTLNAGGFAQVSALSCGSTGNCSAGGSYRDGSGHSKAFLVSEVNGHWRTAFEVPGLASFTGNAQVNAVSCPSAGNCSASGLYTDGFGHTQAFLVSEVNGHWRTAFEVPGSGTLNVDGLATANAVSCPSAGSCSGGGSYLDGLGHSQAFLVSDVNGHWRTAFEVPGSGALNAGGNARVDELSCASAGNCAAAGDYLDGSGNSQAFLVSDVNGHWRTAFEVPGSGALNAGANARVISVSCGSAGNCSAGGFYTDGSGHSQAFLVREVSGRWGLAFEVDGLATLTTGIAQLNAVSCGSAGDCAAGGFYLDMSGHFQAFLVNDVNGHWRTAFEVPGSGALNADGAAEISAVSCPSSGNCIAGGDYADGFGHLQAFLVTEVNGRWRNAFKVPGSGALNAGGNAQVNAVSCTLAGNCAVAGSYLDGFGQSQAFLITKS
jgi:hypothetical protein